MLFILYSSILVNKFAKICKEKRNCQSLQHSAYINSNACKTRPWSCIVSALCTMELTKNMGQPISSPFSTFPFHKHSRWNCAKQFYITKQEKIIVHPSSPLYLSLSVFFFWHGQLDTVSCIGAFSVSYGLGKTPISLKCKLFFNCGLFYKFNCGKTVFSLDFKFLYFFFFFSWSIHLWMYFIVKHFPPLKV